MRVNLDWGLSCQKYIKYKCNELKVFRIKLITELLFIIGDSQQRTIKGVYILEKFRRLTWTVLIITIIKTLLNLFHGNSRNFLLHKIL